MQTEENQIIKIGVGVGDLKIGITKQEALRICPDYQIIKKFAEEKRIFEDYGYSTEQFTQFQIGFDEVIEYHDNRTYPVFKLFLKDNLVNYIVLTSYGKDKAEQKAFSSQFVLENGLGFYDSREKAVLLIGESDKHMDMKSYDGKYTFYPKGLELVFDKNQLRIIYIFKPFTR